VLVFFLQNNTGTPLTRRKFKDLGLRDKTLAATGKIKKYLGTTNTWKNPSEVLSHSP
jgi:hypothetical protein